MNTKFKNAARRVPQNCPPIWFMRQAGRYHSHYQKLKEKYTFDQLSKNPELAAEVALGPIQEFDFDVSILFSDIVYPFQGLGLELDFDPGPKFNELITKENYERYFDIDKALEFMQFQAEAIKATREVLPADKSLIGFVAGPWTLMHYGVDQNSHVDFKQYYLKEVIVPLLQGNIELQLAAGAEKVLMIDSGLQTMGRTFLRDYYSGLLNELVNPDIGYYAKGITTDISHLVLNKMWGGVGFDATIDIKHIMDNKKDGFIQGNFDQNFMLLPEDRFKGKVEEFIEQMKGVENRTGWVCGLGHGIDKRTPEERVHYFIERIRTEFS